MDNGKYSDRAADFALQEYSLLRTEIITYIKDTRSVERNIIVAIGVVWGFLALHPPTPVDRWAWWVAPLFAVAGSIRMWALDKSFREFSSYLKDTEAVFREPGGIGGWEHFLHAKKKRTIFATTAFFCLLMIAATVTVAVYKSIYYVNPTAPTPATAQKSTP